MYEDPSLKQNPYTLHAVMVHEGDANQGHYWAYVFHTGRQVWLKFNDNTVSETTWEAMKKESTGGRMNTSAYSMVRVGSRSLCRHCIDLSLSQFFSSGSVFGTRIRINFPVL